MASLEDRDHKNVIYIYKRIPGESKNVSKFAELNILCKRTVSMPDIKSGILFEKDSVYSFINGYIY